MAKYVRDGAEERQILLELVSLTECPDNMKLVDHVRGILEARVERERDVSRYCDELIKCRADADDAAKLRPLVMELVDAKMRQQDKVIAGRRDCNDSVEVSDSWFFRALKIVWQPKHDPEPKKES